MKRQTSQKMNFMKLTSEAENSKFTSQNKSTESVSFPYKISTRREESSPNRIGLPTGTTAPPTCKPRKYYYSRLNYQSYPSLFGSSSDTEMENSSSDTEMEKYSENYLDEEPRRFSKEYESYSNRRRKQELEEMNENRKGLHGEPSAQNSQYTWMSPAPAAAAEEPILLPMQNFERHYAFMNLASLPEPTTRILEDPKNFQATNATSSPTFKFPPLPPSRIKLVNLIASDVTQRFPSIKNSVFYGYTFINWIDIALITLLWVPSIYFAGTMLWKVHSENKVQKQKFENFVNQSEEGENELTAKINMMTFTIGKQEYALEKLTTLNNKLNELARKFDYLHNNEEISDLQRKSFSEILRLVIILLQELQKQGVDTKQDDLPGRKEIDTLMETLNKLEPFMEMDLKAAKTISGLLELGKILESLVNSTVDNKVKKE